MDKDNIFDKWSPILGKTGLTGSRADWLDQYMQHHLQTEQNDYLGDSLGVTSSFPSMLPIAMRVAAQTIGQDIVTVKPMNFNSEEEFEKMRSEVKSENRERKIDSLIKDKPFEEMKVEEHPDYISGPIGKLLYLDFQYGTSSSI